MVKVLYQGHKEGKEISGFIEAISNKEALDMLKEQGLSQIKFFSDAATGHMREDLEGLPARELKQIAKFELQLQKGIDFKSYLFETMRVNTIPLVIGVGVGLYGEHVGSGLWMAFGVILALALPFFSFWNYGVMQTYNKLLKAVTFGEWEAVKKLSENLKIQSKKPDVQIEADTRLASYYAQQKDMNQALLVLNAHKESIEQKAGVYENKVGMLYMHAHQFDKALYQMKRAYEVSGENMMLADWALAEVRFGDISVAKACLKSIGMASLPVYGLPFISFIEGVIAYKEGDIDNADIMLTQALDGFSSFDKNPAVWAPLTMVSCYLALTKAKRGEEENAKALLSDGIVKIAKEHAEEEFLRALKSQFPSLF